MLIIRNTNTKPEFNLALEEYLLKNINDDIFMLWRNEPAIIVGKNQNTLEEINIDYVKENKISVIRRLTGGGAVFHDLGNINYTFISNLKEGQFNNYEYFTKPVIDFLISLGVPACFSGRNDLLIDGKKFSGNAQTVYKNRIMHHGTLLFSSNMSDLKHALKTNKLKVESKGIKSIRSRVTNISNYLNSMSVVEFLESLESFIIKTDKNAIIYELSEEDIKAVKLLISEKYGTWDWNFGQSPDYNYKKSIKFDCGIVEVLMTVSNGYIKSFKIYGDFFGEKDISKLENIFIGKLHREDIIKDTVLSSNINLYISGLSADDFMKLMF